MKYKCVKARTGLFDKNKIYDITESFTNKEQRLYIYKIYCRAIKRWLEFTLRYGFKPCDEIGDTVNIFGSEFEKYIEQKKEG